MINKYGRKFLLAQEILLISCYFVMFHIITEVTWLEIVTGTLLMYQGSNVIQKKIQGENNEKIS